MRRHLSNSHRRIAPAFTVSSGQVWFLIAGAAATVVILLFLVRAVS